MPSVPIYIKGGIWSNIEDQILKASIQKYGTQSWNKVASLLNKKTAKQCQTRWNEFLNPNLNFEVFTKEEDSRLLDLAKKLPNQWRSIGDLMGRTAQLCIERYNKLLGFSMVDENDDLGLSSSLGFKIGDIKPDAETHPAKPDSLELEDDEREMLSEARARLLNTRGKKATRKIRERMLEESKRIAFLQKRRKLKQAGIDTKIKGPKKKYATDIDYNADIIYEHQPLQGIYDTTEEDKRALENLETFARTVNRKGLHSFQKNDRNKRNNKRPSSTIQQNIFDNKTIIDEYKKPKLDLSDSYKVKSNMQKETENTKELVFSNIFQPTITKIDDNVKPQVKKTIMYLFSKLPNPKNDFEIILEDSDSDNDLEKTETTIKVPLIPKSESIVNDTTILFPWLINLSTQRDLIIPNIIYNPRDEIDTAFNELIISSQSNGTIYETSDVLKYRNEIEIDIVQEFPSQLHNKVDKLLTKYNNPDDIKLKISALYSKIKYLEDSLNTPSIKSRIETVEKISYDLYSETIPKIMNEQHKYYVYYKMYQDECKALQERRHRLEHDLNISLT